MIKEHWIWNSAWVRVTVVLLVGLLVVGTVFAATDASIPHWLVGPGGGIVEGDGLQLRSAIGQPVAGMVSGELSLCSGFLCGPGEAEDGLDTIHLPLILRD